MRGTTKIITFSMLCTYVQKVIRPAMNILGIQWHENKIFVDTVTLSNIKFIYTHNISQASPSMATFCKKPLLNSHV